MVFFYNFFNMSYYKSWQKVNAACQKAFKIMGNEKTPRKLRVLCDINQNQLSHWKNDPKRRIYYEVFNRYEQRILADIEVKVMYHSSGSQTLAGMFILKTYEPLYRTTNETQTAPLTLTLNQDSHNKLPKTPKIRVLDAKIKEIKSKNASNA